MIAFLVVLAILFAVVVIVSAPLRTARRESEPSGELADLEAARDAKYREIRDVELDRATGKLSEADFHAVDGQLRAEALDILDRIDRVAESGSLPSSQTDG
jgi:hypothetical protein